jgi:hypothetical protein
LNGARANWMRPCSGLGGFEARDMCRSSGTQLY